MREVAEAARAAPVPQPARAPDLLLDGMAVLITEGYPSAVAPLKRAVSAFRYGSVSEQEELRWLWPATHAARDVWDYEAWDALSARQVKLDRDAGALIALTPVLSSRALAPVLAGEFTVAASMVAEVESITEATDSSIAPFGALGLAALRGREAEAFDLIETCTKDAERRREGAGLVVIEWATAVLCNGLGRYEQALAAAQRASQNPTGSSLANWALVELVEAAVHDGVPERAVGAVQQLSQVTGACGTDWALGVEARSRALVSGGEAAESLYREAVGRLGRTPLRLDLARARLLYGEWLRRRNRRADAREQLRAAHQMLASMGAAGFAERAARELRATGDRIPGGTTGSPGRLTAREAQIAQLAHEGLSNPDIAAQLFLSPRTVEYHLHKIFTKLGISSRNQLHSVLADGARQAPARAR
jgi:DNA-binding CsgD family transcriptional regulator